MMVLLGVKKKKKKTLKNEIPWIILSSQLVKHVKNEWGIWKTAWWVNSMSQHTEKQEGICFEVREVTK